MIFILLAVSTILLQKIDISIFARNNNAQKETNFLSIVDIPVREHRTLITHINTLIHQKKYKEAINILLTTVEQQKNNSELKEKLAYTYFLNNQYTDARSILNECIEVKQSQKNIYNFIYYSPDYTNADILHWLKKQKKTEYVKQLIKKHSIRNKEYSNINNSLISNRSRFLYSKQNDNFTTIITRSNYSDMTLNIGKNFSLSPQLNTSTLSQNKMKTFYFEFSNNLWFSNHNSLYKINTSVFKRKNNIKLLGGVEYQHHLHKWSFISLELIREIDNSTFYSIINNEIRTKLNLNGSYLHKNNIFSLDTFYAQYDSQVSYSYLNTYLKRPFVFNGYHITPSLGYLYKSFTNQTQNNFWQPKNFEKIYIGSSLSKNIIWDFNVKVHITFSQHTFNYNEWGESIFYKLEIIYTPLDMSVSYTSSKSILWKGEQYSIRLHYLF